MAVEDEEAIRAQLREASRKKRRALEAQDADVKTPVKPETVPVASADALSADKERKSSRRERSRSPRRRERRRDSRRERSSRRHGRSASRSPSGSRSRSRSRSASPSGRSSRRRRHSTHKRRASRSTSRDKDATAMPAKRSRHSSRSTSSKRKVDASDADKKPEETKKGNEDETETENDVEELKTDAADKPSDDKPEDKTDVKKSPSSKDVRRKSSSRKSSRRSRSKSPRSPSRSSRRRRHRSSYSRSRSPSRSRRVRRGGSRSRSPPRDRRARGRDRDRDHRRSRRGRRSYSRSRSRSRSRSFSASRRRRHGRSSSRDRVSRHKTVSSPPSQHPVAGVSSAAPAAPGAVVNPTITQLMAQYPTLSLQEIIAKMQASNVTMAAAVAQKPARELYVGNLPPNVTGPQLQEFLGTIIQQVGLCPQPGNPIVNTWLSTDGHFAFCEMRSAEDCNLALLLNQLSLLGQPLKFGRPRSFMGPLQPPPQISARTQTALTNLGCTPNPAWFSQPTASGVGTGVPTPATNTLPTSASAPAPLATPTHSASVGGSGLTTGTASCRLIMMNVPTVLTEEQVRELVEPFGEVKTFSLVKDSGAGVSLGSAVLEYKDDSVAAEAVKGLNGLEIGGIALSVQRQGDATLGTAPSAKAVAATPDEEKSPVLKMANMVSVDELKDDEEYADLTEDVEEECKRFGAVISLEIPRPKEGEDVPGLGCIFVRFEKEEAAAAALKGLSGRKFGGNIVQVSYFAVAKFEKRDFA